MTTDPLQETPHEVLDVVTGDGWRLALTHYRGSKKPSGYPPILMCHGLNANRLTFDLHPDYSLTRFLLAQRKDVFAIELRGHGNSEKPGHGKHWGWGFNHYAELDLPAAITSVCNTSGHEQLDFIGHSMGGILLYALATSTVAARIRRGITIGSSLDYSHSKSFFHLIAPLAPLSRLLPATPIHWPAKLSGQLSRLSPRFMDKTLVCPNNMNIEAYRLLVRYGTHAVSSQLLRDMARAIDGRGLHNSHGQDYRQLLKQQGYPFPILALSGSHDLQCPPPVAARFGTKSLPLGRPFGQVENYGHHDLIAGVHAPEDVWPEIMKWLDNKNEKRT
jgi:pimeloyl-ACP methyl ester carboxylesterase